HQSFERHEVRADVVANRRVRTAAGFDRADALDWERVVAHQELGVFPGEDVVRHDAKLMVVAKPPAERQEQSGFAASDRASDADRERPRAKIPALRPRALGKDAGLRRIVVLVRCWRMMKDGFGHGTPSL